MTHTPVPLDVAALRSNEFPWMDSGETIYMNAASTGPLPRRAVRVANEWTQQRAEPQHISLGRLRETAATSRRQFAALIGAEEGEIALMTNTTYGLNFAARSLPMRPGTVLTFDGEFPSCVYPFMALGTRGITLERIPLRDGLPDEDAMVHAIARGDVTAVVVSWVQFASGFVVDLDRIGKACRARGVFFIVDAIQGVGVRPIDVHALEIDVLASGAQKWQLSPWGTGFVYVRRALVTQIEPHDVGWACMKASDDYTVLTRYEYEFVEDARRFEVVTLPYHDFAVANASVSLLIDLGVGSIAAHIGALGDRLLQWSASRADVQVLTPADPSRRAGVFAVVPRELDATMDRLRRAGVVFSPREGTIRIAPHCYNTLDEMDRVIAALDA